MCLLEFGRKGKTCQKMRTLRKSLQNFLRIFSCKHEELFSFQMETIFGHLSTFKLDNLSSIIRKSLFRLPRKGGSGERVSKNR